MARNQPPVERGTRNIPAEMGPDQYRGRRPGWVRCRHLPVSTKRGMGVSYNSFSLPWYLVLFIPAIGGLLAGIIIMRWAPETAGSGLDHIIDAVHHHGGKVRARIVPVKIAASALTIGSGGSSGNEGPISQISGGIASFVGTKLHFSRSDMRILVITGMAAGWSAVFRAPLGSAIFAIEVPYKNDLESNAAIPSIISSVTSYLVFIPFGGAGPLFLPTCLMSPSRHTCW